MSDHIDLDGDIDRAWKAYASRLTDYLCAMEDRDVLVIESRYDSTDDMYDCSPGVQFVAGDGALIRGKIPDDRSLHPVWRLTEEEHALLAEQGWRKPELGHSTGEPAGPSFYFVDMPRTSATAEELTVTAVTLFRTVWGFAHPALLRAITRGRASTPPFDVESSAAPKELPMLNAVADSAAAAVLGRPADRTRRGDVMIPLGERTIYLTITDDRCGIEIWATVTSGISDRNRAAAAMPALNRGFPKVRLSMVNDSILAFLIVDDDELTTDTLCEELYHFSEFTSEFADELTRVLDGRTYAELDGTGPGADYSDPELPSNLLDLARTFGYTNPIPAEDVLRICGRNSETLHTYQRLSAEQETRWRQATLTADIRGQADHTGSGELETHIWANVGAALGTALHLLHRPTRSPKPGSQPTLFGDEPEPTLFDDNPTC